ncbi:NKAP domain containing 1 [Syngnathus typhle]|uniref:NKAP domain containing 1 n=1 Tax=Syngnathus typhle TaxID=161592 RepID=UPI002A6AF2C6|nr:NKAP domain containing 1 [Syngnathus typhle]
MSKQTLGKTLLRNVIRHTDAHNKIQEESEMWKLRGWEVQMSNNSHMSATKTIRGQMHCDRLSYQSRISSEHDDRETRYWTRKLYDFEDNDPDRWGHSGFKELYPEEFASDSDKSSTVKEEGHKSKASKSKRSKKKKKKRKKKKEEEEEGKKKSEDGSDDDKTKNRHKSKKKERKDEDRRKRKRKNDDSHKHSDSAKKHRRDWKAAGQESTDESSEE